MNDYQVTLSFPGTLDQALLSQEPKVIGGRIDCLVNGSSASVHPLPFIESEMESNKRAHELKGSLVNLVSRDITSIGELIPKFLRLEKGMPASKDMCYEQKDGVFKVYDYSGRPGAFSALERIRGDAELFAACKTEISELAKRVSTEREKLPFVTGATLDEAASAALQIYQMAEALKNVRSSYFSTVDAFKLAKNAKPIPTGSVNILLNMRLIDRRGTSNYAGGTSTVELSESGQKTTVQELKNVLIDYLEELLPILES